MPFATVNGARLFYDVVGCGSRLVVLHHGHCSCHATFTAVGFVDDLARACRCHATDITCLLLDCRGAGQSEHVAGPETYTIAQLADDVTALVDAVFPARCAKPLLHAHRRAWGTACVTCAHLSQSRREVHVRGALHGMHSGPHARAEGRTTPR